ncbi:MAG: gluconate 2-dehydrogenase subunit 3 family protein [Saprospiraceae bacterium]
MDRRDTLKSLLIGGVAGATIGTAGCKMPDEKLEISLTKGLGYGRTESEEMHDIKLNAEQLFSEHELATIAVLCDIILPASSSAGSATDAEVPAFIEFISKDLPTHQLPLQGGIMWLDGESNRRFNNLFATCTNAQQISIVNDIAYPDPDKKKPEMGPGISFF